LIIGKPESTQSPWSHAYVEGEATRLGSRLAELVMTTKEIGDRLPVSLFEASLFSTSSFSCSDGDGFNECVVCLRKFHGGEEIRTLPCDQGFHKSCVDKWILDYENMACPLCIVCLVFLVEDELKRSRELGSRVLNVVVNITRRLSILKLYGIHVHECGY
jgi:hypothetical protein